MGIIFLGYISLIVPHICAKIHGNTWRSDGTFKSKRRLLPLTPKGRMTAIADRGDLQNLTTETSRGQVMNY